MANEDPNVTVARFSFKQAIVVAVITGATTLGGTLLTMKSTNSTNGSQPNEEISNNRSGCDEELADLKSSLQKSISISSLVDMSSMHFDSEGDQRETKESIRKLINTSELYKKDSEHYMHKLFRLKKMMLANGGNINVRVSSANQEACKLIQDLLKGIEYYRGTVDGNIESTRGAVENFQHTLNNYTPGYFAERNIGIVGKKTFSAIMEHYEKN